MIFLGKQEALDFISEWESKLSISYYKEWNGFKQKRNVIAKKMGLNEKEMLFISVVYLSGYIAKDLKTTNDLMATGKMQSANNDAEVMMVIGKITDVYSKYLGKCAYFKPQFDMEMEKLNNNRR